MKANSNYSEEVKKGRVMKRQNCKSGSGYGKGKMKNRMENEMLVGKRGKWRRRRRGNCCYKKYTRNF